MNIYILPHLDSSTVNILLHLHIYIHSSPYVYTLLHMSTHSSPYVYTLFSICVHSPPYVCTLFHISIHSSPCVYTLFPFAKTSESRFQTSSYIALKCQPASAKDGNKHDAPTRLKKININSVTSTNIQSAIRFPQLPACDIHKFSSTLYCTSTVPGK